MSKIAHVVHPVVVPPTSDLTIAQPVTFRSMEMAREYARGKADIELFTVKYADEDPLTLREATRLPDLDRSVKDVASFEEQRKLAILDDILKRLYDHTDAEYLIYTNVDIAVLPHFYVLVRKIIEQGYDAFAINRRTISDRWQSPEELPFMYSDIGDPHPGHDCFVFKRSVYPKYILENLCIGTEWIARTLLTSVACNAEKYYEFKDLHATFHIGDTRVWRTERYLDYSAHNKRIFLKACEHYDKQNRLAAFPDLMHRYQQALKHDIPSIFFALQKEREERRKAQAIAKGQRPQSPRPQSPLEGKEKQLVEQQEQISALQKELCAMKTIGGSTKWLAGRMLQKLGLKR